eukprot:TRINITY_DN9697_c0_g1_i1.p1 TRINITY_DN9697_c0_g1~~TRINITY_DN9697_c0_g1_i1.p1  ORF type:complete len:203 (-),score=27.65 TRINITY_DN9697_c0_g1_i1:151-759(-)
MGAARSAHAAEPLLVVRVDGGGGPVAALPHDPLVGILSWLPRRSRRWARLVCRRWNDALPQRHPLPPIDVPRTICRFGVGMTFCATGLTFAVVSIVYPVAFGDACEGSVHAVLKWQGLFFLVSCAAIGLVYHVLRLLLEAVVLLSYVTMMTLGLVIMTDVPSSECSGTVAARRIIFPVYLFFILSPILTPCIVFGWAPPHRV